MKKLLLIALSLVAFAGLASATHIDCGAILMSPNNAVAALGPLCTADAGVGFHITSITLGMTDDYTGYISGASPFPTVDYTIAFTVNDPGFGAINGTGAGCQVTTSGSNNSISCINTPQTINAVFGQTLGVELNGQNIVSGGQVAGTSVVYTLDYTTAPDQQGGVPEPATLGLMGGSLLGLGFLARRKK